MFRRHQKYSPSTGEPPTPPVSVDDDRLTMTASVQARNDSEQQAQNIFFGSTPPTPTDQQTERGRSSTDQSDSGYEMSPNIPGSQPMELFLSDVFDEDGHCSETLPDEDVSSECTNSPSLPGVQFNFDEQQFLLESDVLDDHNTCQTLPEHDNCQIIPEEDDDSQTLPVNPMSETVSLNDEDTDGDICSVCANPDGCSCNNRLSPCSSSTSARSRETPLNCDTYTRPSELSSYSRPPSTLPIEIPARRLSSNALPSPSFSRLRLRPSPPHSLPIAPPRVTFNVFLSRSQARSLPLNFASWNQFNPDNFSRRRRNLSSLSIPRNRLQSTNSSLFFTSLESFDDGDENVFEDGDDNVFYEAEEYDMAEDDAPHNPEQNRPRLNSVANPVRQPLPDLVMHEHVNRRSRSASINLPCDHNEEVLRNIGRSLRRISDDFQRVRRQSNGDVSTNGDDLLSYAMKRSC